MDTPHGFFGADTPAVIFLTETPQPHKRADTSTAYFLTKTSSTIYSLTTTIGLTFCHDTPSIIEGNYRLGGVRCQTAFPKKDS